MIWFVDYDDRIYRSHDSGQTWTPLPSGRNTFENVAALAYADDEILVLSQYGHLWRYPLHEKEKK